jgi:MatE
MTRVDGAEGWARSTIMSAIGAELHATLALAAPLAAANLAQIAMGVTDSVMVGRLGTLPLAAAGLGGMLYFSGGVMLQGILTAVAPLAAQALGAGDRAAAGRMAGAGLALAGLFALPFCAPSAMIRSSPARSAASCGRSPGGRRPFSALPCCAAFSPRCRASVPSWGCCSSASPEMRRSTGY